MVTTDSIAERYRKLQNDRRQKTNQLMDEYDRETYYPALRSLREECEKEGHVRGNYHDNGLGWTWFWCIKCGAAFDKDRS